LVGTTKVLGGNPVAVLSVHHKFHMDIWGFEPSCCDEDPVTRLPEPCSALYI